MKTSTTIILFLFLLSTLRLSAQFIYPTSISNDVSTFNQPTIIIPADMDNDGDIDIVAASIFSDIVWYENLDGQGAMDNPKIVAEIPETTGAFFMSVSDIDKDGILDVIATTTNDFNSFWIKNTIEETATFSERKSLGLSNDSYVSNLKMEDVDGDNILDIIGIGSDLSWLRGIDNNGNYHPEETLIQRVVQFELADFDFDGDLDMVCYTYAFIDGDWHYNLELYQNEDANFSLIQSIDTNTELNVGSNLQLADLDTDGDLDIILGIAESRWGPYTYNWYENKISDDGIWIKQAFLGGNLVPAPVIYDIDTDGDLDIVTSEDGLRIYENVDGLGDFEPGNILTPIGGRNLVVTDINNDNIEDIISIDNHNFYQYKEQGLIYFGRTNQTFENPVDFIADADDISIVGEDVMKSWDLNGDGVKELITSHSFVRRINWQSYDDSYLKFSNPRIIDDIQASDIDFADFNGDNLEDIVVTTSGEEDIQVVWYERLGDETTFSEPNVINYGTSGHKQVEVADFDNDGDIDIIVNKLEGSNTGVHWFENLDGLGSFSTLQTLSNTVFDFIEIDDIDLDGDIDVIGVDKSNGFYWFENESFIFSQPSLLLAVEDIEDYLLEDLNGNGWKDIICLYGFNNVSLSENNGSVGDFSDLITITNIGSSTYDRELFLRDFDLDGDLDLLIAFLRIESRILWLENIGNSDVFSAPIPLGLLPDYPSRIQIDDFDGDSDIDFIQFSSELNGQTVSLSFGENYLNKPRVIGKTYLDINENGNFDLGELLINSQSMTISPDEITSFPTDSGYFYFVVENGIYDVACNIPPLFEFTTSSTQEVEVSQGLNSEVYFGVHPTTEVLATEIHLTTDINTCNLESPVWIDYKNTGTIAGNTQITLEFDTLATYLSAIPEPDSIVGQNMYWNHPNLAPTISGHIQVIFQIPGAFSIGEFLSFKSSSTLTSLDNSQVTINEFEFSDELTCAYDPNDKSVTPSIPENDNYTLFGDTLDYTVRFQNTGTAPAMDVVIEDYLDKDLDYSTLEVLSASHYYEATLDQITGRLLFTFDNIMLPDSFSNEAESHGYFRYRIQHKEGLPENTYIQNYASIFFDFNPPIVTNTVENILVSEYPLLVDIKQPSCIGNNDNGSLTLLFELPFQDSIKWSTGDTELSIDNLSPSEYGLTIYNSDGTQVDTTFLIISPPTMELLAPTINPIQCFGINTGAIETTIASGTPSYYYEWSNSTFAQNQYNLAPGNYSLTVTDINNCKDSLQVTLEAPQEIILTNETTPEVNLNIDGTISIEASGGVSPYTYSWSHNANEDEHIVFGLAAGDYTVTVTDANDCEQIQTITVGQITSTSNLNEQFNFKISPNPNNGAFIATFNLSNQEDWQVNVTNSIGQLIETVQSPEQGSTHENLAFNLDSGLYQISLLIEGRIIHSEIVIVK